MAAIDSSSAHTQTLDNLSGEAVLAIAPQRYEASQSLIRSTYSCSAFAGDDTRLAQRECAWGRVQGADADRNGSGSATGYEWQTLTTQVGGQAELRPDWFLGGTLGYEASEVDGKHDTADVDGDAALAALTLKRQAGPLLLAGGLDFGYGWYDSTRKVEVGATREHAKASPEALSAGLHGRAAYQFAFDRWYLQPQLDLDATYVRTDSYHESGAGAFDLDVDSADKLVFSTTPGLELGARLAMPDGAPLRAYAGIGLSLVSANNWEADARFKDAPASAGDFRNEISTPNVLGRLTVGLEAMTVGPVTVKAQYDGTLASNYESHAGSLRVSWLF